MNRPEGALPRERDFESKGRIRFEQRALAGHVEISTRPGLGIDLNLEEIAKHPYQAEALLPLFKPGWERREGEPA